MAKPFAVKQIHKQMYPATYNFRDDTVGSEPDGWTASNDANCSTNIVAQIGNHRNVLQLYDFSNTGNAYISRTFTTSHTTGGIDLWIRSNDVTDECQIQVLGAATIGIQIQVESDKIQYYHTAAWNDATGGAVSNDTWYHFSIIFSCTTDTYDFYCNGVLLDAAIPFRDVQDNLQEMRLQTDDADTDYRYYIDAIGFSWDTDYYLGDNYHWRHYTESTDSFELDNIGDQGTNVLWVDAVDTTASTKIIGEFTAHKKILRGYYSSAAGGFDYSYHNFASQATAGIFECFLKTSDATIESKIVLYDSGVGDIVRFRISGDKFQIEDTGAFRDVTSGPTPADYTWYHIKIVWFADDTFDLWIDNIKYEDGVGTVNGQVSGVNRVYFIYYSAGEYMYVDAPTCSLDSDLEGDNRLYAYNDTYNRETITDDIISARKEAIRLQPIFLTFKSEEEYDGDLYIFQFYDVNSKMAFEGEIKTRIQERLIREYTLRDKLFDDLAELINNTFSADAIHDDSDATCLLKVALPNVAQEDGDLILLTADAKATTYSPTLINYPTTTFLQDIEDLADSNIIIKPNGKVYLDDDLASGSSLDVDTAADRAKFTALSSKGPIRVTDILDSINYFEIFGAINPDTGARFSKTIDNSSTGDKLRKWRYINNNLRSQTDVDNYAAQLATRMTTIKIIEFAAQDIGDFDLGTTFDFKYVEGVYNVTQANYYIISEVLEFEKNKTTLTLSEGMLELSKFAAQYERSFEETNQYSSKGYDTDIVTHSLPIWPGNGATTSDYGVQLDANLEDCRAFIYLPTTLDVARNIEVDLGYKRLDADNDVHDILYAFQDNPGDGTDDSWTNRDNGTESFPAVAQNKYNRVSWTVSASTLNAGYLTRFLFTNWDAAAQIAINSVTIRYYIRRI